MVVVVLDLPDEERGPWGRFLPAFDRSEGISQQFPEIGFQSMRSLSRTAHDQPQVLSFEIVGVPGQGRSQTPPPAGLPLRQTKETHEIRTSPFVSICSPEDDPQRLASLGNRNALVRTCPHPFRFAIARDSNTSFLW